MASTSREYTASEGSAGAVRLAPRPAPETARLVQFSCQRLLVVESEFAGAFHRELCALIPQSLPALDSGATLSGELAHCVLWAALARDPTGLVEDRVRAFAGDHHARGFPDEAYPNLCHALLRSVRSIQPAGWTSELSSGWVSYGLWLRPHLEMGAQKAPDSTVGPRLTPPTTLEAILADLRVRYFSGQDRALNSVCTRVMLRTGADLRAPRPEQSSDPQVIAEVLESLLLMGFTPVVGPGTDSAPTPAGARVAGPGMAGPGMAGPGMAGPGMAGPGMAGQADRGIPDDSGSGRRQPGLRWGWRRRRTDHDDQSAHRPQR